MKCGHVRLVLAVKLVVASEKVSAKEVMDTALSKVAYPHDYILKLVRGITKAIKVITNDCEEDVHL